MVSLRLPKRREMTVAAPVWKRVLAFIADLFVLDLVALSPFTGYFSAFQPSLQDAVRQTITLPPGAVLAVALIGVLALAYFSAFEYYLGATPGMLLFRLRVGGDRSWWRCVLRNAYALTFFPFTILWVVEPLHLAFRRERLLERWSRTGTVQTIQL